MVTLMSSFEGSEEARQEAFGLVSTIITFMRRFYVCQEAERSIDLSVDVLNRRA